MVVGTNGEPVNGGVITFAGPGSGASTNPATATVTISGGAASRSVSANSTPGDYQVTASANGANSVTFSLTNQAVPTLSVTNSPVTYTGSPQTATVTASVDGTVSHIKYNGSTTPPTTVGGYTVTADFAPTDSTHYVSLTGAVTFKEGASILGTSNLVDGCATLTIESLPVGPHTITAEYDGIVSDTIVLQADQYLIIPLIFKSAYRKDRGIPRGRNVSDMRSSQAVDHGLAALSLLKIAAQIDRE